MSAAVYRYQRWPPTGARAASLAGVSFDEMKSALAARGIPLRLGDESVAEMLDDLRALSEEP